MARRQVLSDQEWASLIAIMIGSEGHDRLQAARAAGLGGSDNTIRRRLSCLQASFYLDTVTPPFAGRRLADIKASYDKFGGGSDLLSMKGVEEAWKHLVDWLVANPTMWQLYRAEASASLQAVIGSRLIAANRLIREVEPLQLSPDQNGRDVRGERERLCGRATELGVINAVLESVTGDPMAHAPCRVVLIGGESGVGKTALMQAVLALARQSGLRVLFAMCEPFHEGMSFFPIRELVRQVTDSSTLVAEITRLFGQDTSEVTVALAAEQPSVDPSYRHDALIATFANVFLGRYLSKGSGLSDGRPLVLALDDLERVDTGTVDALICLIARIHEGPLLLIGAYRTDVVNQAARDHPLRRILRETRRIDGLLCHIRLEALGRDQLRDLVDALLGAPARFPSRFYDRLHEETEGNPLFVREVLRSLSRPGPNSAPALSLSGGVWMLDREVEQWEIPATVEDAISARLDLLHVDQRAELEIAAVIGARFAFRVISQVTQQVTQASEQQLLAYLEAFLDFDIIRELTDADDMFEFSHGKIRDVLLQSISRVRVRRLHSAVADVMARLKVAQILDDDWDVAIGEHLMHAGRDEEAHPLLLSGAQALVKDGHYRSASAMFERALLTAPHGLSEADRLGIELAQGEALKLSADYPAAKAILTRLANQELDRRTRNWALNHLADVELLTGHAATALETYAQCLQIAESRQDNELVAETVGDLVELHARQVEELAGVDAHRANVHRQLHEEFLSREVMLAEGSEDKHRLARAYRNQAKLHRIHGEFDLALGFYEKSIECVGGRVLTHRYHIPYAKTLRLVGRNRDALAVADRVLDWCRQVGSYRSEAIARQCRGIILLDDAIRQQRLDALDVGVIRDQLLMALTLHKEAEHDLGVRETHIALGELALVTGDVEAAAEHLAQAIGHQLELPKLAEAAAYQLRANGESDRADRLVSLTGGSKSREPNRTVTLPG